MSSRVVLVRGARSVTGGGGGCCSGDVRPFDDGGHRHAGPVVTACAPSDGVAALYLALRAALPQDIDVQVVSPSNWVWLLPALLRDGWLRGLRGRELLRSVRCGMAVHSVVADGQVLFSGWLPDPASGVAAVRAALVPR